MSTENDPASSSTPEAHQTDTETPATEHESGGLPPYISPTLLRLTEKERPATSTLCEVCPASLWLRSVESGLKCYCPPLHAMVWQPDNAVSIQECDGYQRAEAQRQTGLAGKA